MYLYVFDEFVQDKKYQKELANIETRLTDLGISGKIARLALFRNAEEMIRDDLRRGVTTVVAVGNDETVKKMVNVAAESGITLGVIPLGVPQNISGLLGMPYGVAACEVLSARSTETIDTGVVNGTRFITGISIPNFKAELTCEDSYRIRAYHPGSLEIRNLAIGEVTNPDQVADPRDGRLEAVISVAPSKRKGLFGRRRGSSTVLSLSSMLIKSEYQMSLYADGEKMKGVRFEIGVEPMSLKVITGKGRMF